MIDGIQKVSEEFLDENERSKCCDEDDNNNSFLPPFLHNITEFDPELSTNIENPNKPPQKKYVSTSTSSANKKPKWWKRLAGRRGTKVQRASMERMKVYMIPKTPYGTFLDLKELLTTDVQTQTKNNLVDLPIWLEIGFGNGLNLLANAKNHTDRIFFGAEMHQPGVGNLCLRMEDEQHKERSSMLEDNISNKDGNSSKSKLKLYSNIRIYPGDGTKLLNELPPNSIRSVLITFPDPFINKNQEKWRIVQNETINQIKRVLQPNCGRFYLATDVEEYDIWTRTLFQGQEQQNDDAYFWVEVDPTPPRKDWLPVISQYEEKGLREGRRTHLQCWELCE